MDDERPQYECPTSGIGHDPAETGMEEASARHSGSGGCAGRPAHDARWINRAQVELSLLSSYYYSEIQCKAQHDPVEVLLSSALAPPHTSAHGRPAEFHG